MKDSSSTIVYEIDMGENPQHHQNRNNNVNPSRMIKGSPMLDEVQMVLTKHLLMAPKHIYLHHKKKQVK